MSHPGPSFPSDLAELAALMQSNQLHKQQQLATPECALGRAIVHLEGRVREATQKVWSICDQPDGGKTPSML